MTGPADVRFAANFSTGSRTSCWNWTAGRDRHGYGVIRDNGRQWRAHRFAWKLYRGPIPAGLLVCHRCDNRRCVNPEHLFLGTKADNSRDMVLKGRSTAGELHPAAKLTADAVREIRIEHGSGQPVRLLAARYGVGERAIQKIVRGTRWTRTEPMQ